MLTQPTLPSRPRQLLLSNAADAGVSRSVLPGGIRVVTERVPGVRSASIGVWVGVGSRDEDPAVAGAAHFLEHLLFKATPTRSALEINQSLEAVGGELNAFTSKEHTCFYAHVIDEDLAMAIDVVSDVVLRGLCREADVDLERQVVLEELAMRDDDFEDLVGDALLEALFGSDAIGRPIIGTEDTVMSMGQEALHTFHVQRYTPEKMVIAVAGNIEHDEVVRLITAAFADSIDPDIEPAPVRAGERDLVTKPGTTVIHRKSEQTHLAIGAQAFGRHDLRHRWPLAVLNTVIGGGLSSRLFQEIRETRGLAYSVYSGVDTFSDTGTFSVYAGCQPEHVAEVAGLIRDVLSDVALNGITESECSRAKGSLRGGLVLGLEDSSSRMNRIGRSELNYGKHHSVSSVLERIADVTPEQVAEVARIVLSRPFALAVVGPYKKKSQVPAELRALAGQGFLPG
ncbi:M16 family metallopeptidase [Smaragdicoccus niigatensis]|uniref:M16 family metallopeptidase n=1 Tax=Smaragdicoccus niigatensis TaxID=359359 RepID=UPI00058DE97D